jgi:hypothetical protein
MISDSRAIKMIKMSRIRLVVSRLALARKKIPTPTTARIKKTIPPTIR